MRKTAVLGMTMVAAALMGLGGCNNSTKTEAALLKDENQALRAQLADRNAALEASNAEARERAQELMRLQREREEGGGMATSGGRTGFEGIEGVTGSVSAGEVTATVDSDLLFDSGKATLKPSAKKSLDQVASVIQSQYSGRQVKIAGHTDSDPIKKSGWKTNYHLGFERALAVRDYLLSRGVPANRMYVASFGPDVPRGNKSQSRRVEIAVVMPN